MPRGYSPFKVLAFFCGWQNLFAGAAALFQRQQLDSSRLTGWDEMAAFMGIAELARMLDMNTSTTHRYVTTLLAVGLIERDPATRRYRVAAA